MDAMPPPAEDKKRRLSFGKLLGRKDKDSSHKHHSSEAPSSTSNVADSAYASSENNESMVPVKNTGQIEGVSSSRNLALNKNTGDVLDEETGEVLSTVTTTTTTTTTTTMRSGKDGGKVTTVQTTPGPSAIQEMPAESLAPAPSVDDASSTSVSPAPQQNASPDVPNKSGLRKSGDHPYRKSREMMVENPVSPVEGSNPNFSRPNRNNLRPSADEPIDKRPPSTIDSLKAAAIGIHGVGETLRGTINNEADSRLPRRNADKNAYAEEKNRATLEAGQREMAGLRDRAGLQPTVTPDRDKHLPDLPHQPNYTYHPNAPQNNMTALPTMKSNNGYVPPTGTAVPQDHYDEDTTSYETAANSVGGQEPTERKTGALRKLMKRKPLNK